MKKPAQTTRLLCCDTSESLVLASHKKSALLASYKKLVEVLDEIQDRFQLYFSCRAVPEHVYDAQVSSFEEDLAAEIEIARRDLVLSLKKKAKEAKRL